MNAKLLFAATVALSLASSFVLADEGTTALTRDQVNAQVRQAMADGSLQRTDYDLGAPVATRSTVTRADVYAEFVADKAARKVLVGPDANRTFNPQGVAKYAKSTLTRAEVKTEVLQAAAAGTLHRTDFDDLLPASRRAPAPRAVATLAQRVKTLLSRDAS